MSNTRSHDDIIKRNLHRFEYRAGVLYWSGNFGPRAREGRKVGSMDTHGYLQVKLDGKYVLVHRIIWYMFNQDSPPQVDHINRVRGDNRIENLRASNNTLNQQNTSTRTDNTSGHAGVSFNKHAGKWLVRLSVSGRRLYLGCFDELTTAVAAHKQAKDKYHAHATQTC